MVAFDRPVSFTRLYKNDQTGTLAHRHAHTSAYHHFYPFLKINLCLENYILSTLSTSIVTSSVTKFRTGLPSSTPWTIWTVTMTKSRTMRRDGPKVAKWLWTSWRGTSSTRHLAPGHHRAPLGVVQMLQSSRCISKTGAMPGRWNGFQVDLEISR